MFLSNRMSCISSTTIHTPNVKRTLIAISNIVCLNSSFFGHCDVINSFYLTIINLSFNVIFE